MIKHSMRLEGPAAHGGRISIHVLRDLSDALLDAAQRSLRLRVEGRSSLHGHPAWLDDATRFELVGLSEGSTVLELEAPTLGEAAPRIFDRLPMWEFSPQPDQTAFSLVEEATREAISGNPDTDLLDRNILESLACFGRVLSHGYDALTLDNGRRNGAAVRVTASGLETADRLRRESPAPERAIVSGYLDELKHSKRAFSLRLPDGHTVQGLLPPGDPSTYGALWGKHVVIDGEASFRPSGAVFLLLAENIQAAAEADSAWGHVPRPRPISIEELKPRIAPRPGASGMDQVFGRWPGDETDEQIMDALSHIG